MHNDTTDNMEENILNDDPSFSDRDVPQNAKQGNGRSIAIIIVGLLALSAIFILAYGELTKNNKVSGTITEEIMFRAPATRHEPYIVDEVRPPPVEELAVAPNDPEKDALLQHRLALQAQAMRIAKERQAELENRLKSPQLVYDKATLSPSQNYNQTANNYDNSGASLLSGGSNNDPNLAFANEQSNLGFETTKATQLKNLNTLITQGEMISGILETAIQSDLPGMVRAIVSENIYSFKGSNLLIPRGTRLVGQYRSGIKKGQSRVFIIWNRLIRPDGASINIGSIGTDALGRSGLGGDVDTHFMERFGSSILLSIINGGLNAAVDSIDNNDGSDISLSMGNDFSRSSEIALENSIGIKPTIHIDQGMRIKIFVGKDLDFTNVGAFQLH